MTKEIKAGRVSQIDFLRAIAVILVLFRHHKSIQYLQYIGWAGVDLFFVLSGFLVTSLIFKEYRSTHTFRVKNFLIRRGLKIYPTFYVFIFLSVLFIMIARYFFGYEKTDFYSKIIYELIFVQNYYSGLWAHTWSLAVEEHFYLVVSLFLFLIVRIDRVWMIGLPYIITIILVCILILRILHLDRVPEIDYLTHIYPTHFRVDSLLFGSLLAYMYVFSEPFNKILRRKYISFIALMSGCVIVFLTLDKPLSSPFMVTYGFSFLYIGFGLILIALLFMDSFFKRLEQFYLYRNISLIGKYSYSIYLFHMFLPSIFDNVTFFDAFDFRLRFILYIIASISLGVMISKVIEYPVLRVRDKLFPSKVSAL